MTLKTIHADTEDNLEVIDATFGYSVDDLICVTYNERTGHAVLTFDDGTHFVDEADVENMFEVASLNVGLDIIRD